ncbi:MAG: glycosyltransferase family 2 protein [Candidatus Omnitrophota bacterium]
MKKTRNKRVWEIIPGALSWGVITGLIILAIFRPVACAIFILIFDFYWIIRTLYLTTLLVMAHRKLYRQKYRDWLSECENLKPADNWQKLRQLIIFPVYKEGPEILRASLKALFDSHYSKDKMIVVVAFEERNPFSKDNAKILEAEFGKSFFAYLSTFHPENIAGEARTKGANATWAARQAQSFLKEKEIPYEDVLVSCFDSDTCVDSEYFGCLTYHFLNTHKPHQASYQPIPVYNNNIWHAPSFARIVEMSGSFCQMMESMRVEKFVTFSSHSMSFKTLVDIGFWPVDMISDDSVIYWKAFIHYKGNYRVVPLYVTVSMDAAYSRNLLQTIIMQYKQKRRWAWGVENFPFVMTRFIKDRDISFFLKIRRSFNLLEGHVTWAIWATILVLIGPLPILLGGSIFKQLAISYNLPNITGFLFNFTIGASIIWILLSRSILPPRPKDVSWAKNIVMCLEWAIIPLTILILGSAPALDAQTRLMLAKYMEFNATEKKKLVV